MGTLLEAETVLLQRLHVLVFIEHGTRDHHDGRGVIVPAIQSARGGGP
jgi:hypothetical protein